MPVRRVEYLDGPEAHLSHGMRHVGYDADAETHQYRDPDGSLWQSAPGSRHGRLRLVQRAAPSASAASGEARGRRDQRAGGGAARSATAPGTAGAGEAGRRSRRESDASTLVGDDDPPPPYPGRRRFTSFDQLYEGGEGGGRHVPPASHAGAGDEGRPHAPAASHAGAAGGDGGDGVLRRLGRSLSTRLRAGSGAGRPAAAGGGVGGGLARARSTVARLRTAAGPRAAGAAGGAADKGAARQRAEIGRGGGRRSVAPATRGLDRRGTI